MTEQEIIKECECLFQNGGPRVYIFNPIRDDLVPTQLNAKWALIHANSSEQIWTRRKVGSVYRWRAAHKV